VEAVGTELRPRLRVVDAGKRGAPDLAELDGTAVVDVAVGPREEERRNAPTVLAVPDPPLRGGTILSSAANCGVSVPPSTPHLRSGPGAGGAVSITFGL
jgi:hypothetical protein